MIGQQVVEELNKVREASMGLQEKTRSHVHALRIARLIEAKLKNALAGEVLRGTHLLVPDGGVSFRGYSITGERTSTWLDRTGKMDLVLGKAGNLQMARVHGLGVAYRDVRDDEIRGEHLLSIVAAVLEACKRHVERAGDAVVRRDSVADLAGRVERALG